MHMLQNLFYLTTALHVSGVTITYLQNKTTVTIASGNRYTVTDRVKFTDRDSIEHIAFSAEYTLFNNNCNFNLIYM